MALDLTKASDQLRARRDLRLDTLIKLRWLAVAGQAVALIGVRVVLGFPLPLVQALLVIALSAALNVALRFMYPVSHRMSGAAAGSLLAYDVLQLAALLFLTGGLENPFAVLFLAPVMISATALPPKITLLLGALVAACASGLALYRYPLPWPTGGAFELPLLYVGGIWCALMLALGFIGVYAWRVSEEGREIAQALAATELVLAREQHLSALDGLAAAAAHELGTPLATIALVSKELERALVPGPHDEDMVLLREQVARCRDILKKLTSLDEQGAPFDSMAVSHLVEEIAEPHRNFGVEIDVKGAGAGAEPRCLRNASVLYGLGNIVENAVDFAASRVEVEAHWDADRIEIEIRDDGPGFSPDIMWRLGEPYVSSRTPGREQVSEGGGLGLGFFIAKTLLERSGARVALANRLSPETGARVRIVWARARFDAPAQTAEGGAA
ncbi:ActS/PrrB/RegB family redox-sensitive histidine kinase [Methylopila sp. M107]|uniref:ActS/PrrB/RegB family redox-sensitive histidine kinase n=1 Tax=Methylopila sp. M107 TaxID=1101190 RepID=UPI0003631C2E|nr:ActS/PrrB/RegB family redox-sensitive histidine kinase [Methylopila sp. M107]